MLERLGERNPIDVLSSSTRVISELLGGASLEAVVRPRENEWSPHQILTHLSDAEMVYGVRIRLIMTLDKPDLTAYDQDEWVRRFGQHESLSSTFALFRALRGSNLKLYATLTAQELQRVGIHQERGEESIETIIRLLGGHDLNHIDQMRRSLAVTY